jgi:hypothetical protein
MPSTLVTNIQYVLGVEVEGASLCEINGNIFEGEDNCDSSARIECSAMVDCSMRELVTHQEYAKPNH